MLAEIVIAALLVVCLILAYLWLSAECKYAESDQARRELFRKFERRNALATPSPAKTATGVIPYAPPGTKNAA